MTTQFPDPSQSPWTDPNTGEVYVWDAESQSWLVQKETGNGSSETLDSVSKRSPVTTQNISTGPTINLGESGQLNTRNDSTKSWDTWDYFRSPSGSLNYRGIGVYKGTVLILGSDGSLSSWKGILKSSDHGRSWKRIFLPEPSYWYSVKHGRNNRWIAVANGGNHTMIKSDDDGESWSRIVLPESVGFYDIATDTIGTWVAISYDVNKEKQVFVSNDNGETWKQSAAPYQYRWSSIAYAKGTWIAVAETGATKHRVLRSTNRGVSWTAISVPDDDDWSYVETDGSGTWVAIASGGFGSKCMRSTDDGLTWTQVTVPTKSYTGLTTDRKGNWVASIYPGSNQADKGQILVSEDNGLSFSIVNVNDRGGSFRSIATTGDGIWFMCGPGGDGQIYILRETGDDTGLFFNNSKVAVFDQFGETADKANNVEGLLPSYMPYNLATLPYYDS